MEHCCISRTRRVKLSFLRFCSCFFVYTIPMLLVILENILEIFHSHWIQFNFNADKLIHSMWLNSLWQSNLIYTFVKDDNVTWFSAWLNNLMSCVWAWWWKLSICGKKSFKAWRFKLRKKALLTVSKVSTFHFNLLTNDGYLTFFFSTTGYFTFYSALSRNFMIHKNDVGVLI